jgi:poly(A) polymerase Pap1
LSENSSTEILKNILKREKITDTKFLNIKMQKSIWKNSDFWKKTEFILLFIPRKLYDEKQRKYFKLAEANKVTFLLIPKYITE